MAFQDREHIRSLHFHKTCGGNIALLKNGKMAHRTEGFNDGITFTDRPVKIDELISLKISETEKNWSGALRLGFTSNDPSSMISNLPINSYPDFISIPGNWAKPIKESLNKKNYEIAFYVDKRGDAYYRYSDEKDYLLLTSVDTKSKLWGVIDVYGNTVKVELLSSRKEEASSNFDENFHCIHGSHIKLDEKQIVASRVNGITSCYVFGCRPMQFDEKVVVKIIEIDPCIRGPFEYGLTSCDPFDLDIDALPKIGRKLSDFSSDYWVYKEDNLFYQPGDIVTFVLKSSGRFIATKNGNALASNLTVDASKPLWLFFKLSGTILKICMMGTSVKEYSALMKEFRNITLSASQVKENKSEPKQMSIGDCVVCYDKQVNCTLYRCGHMCMCYDCAETLRKNSDSCPVCRKVISDIIKVYL